VSRGQVQDRLGATGGFSHKEDADDRLSPGAMSDLNPADASRGYELRPVGAVQSELIDPSVAPKQGDEGGPEAWLVLDAAVAPAARDLRPGDEIIVLTWLHRARRDVLEVHPRDDPENPERGVFSTRSQDRPNPIGLHRVTVVAVEATRIRVRDMEAINGTPIVDLKPALAPRDR
jgi:tRNA-Thr(GGU) m(6)t(6)A37 methyltransferase TsaA